VVTQLTNLVIMVLGFWLQLFASRTHINTSSLKSGEVRKLCLRIFISRLIYCSSAVINNESVVCLSVMRMHTATWRTLPHSVTRDPALRPVSLTCPVRYTRRTYFVIFVPYYSL